MPDVQHWAVLLMSDAHQWALDVQHWAIIWYWCMMQRYWVIHYNYDIIIDTILSQHLATSHIEAYWYLELFWCLMWAIYIWTVRAKCDCEQCAWASCAIWCRWWTAKVENLVINYLEKKGILALIVRLASVWILHELHILAQMVAKKSQKRIPWPPLHLSLASSNFSSFLLLCL